jgi:aminoglycoside 2'-N-acetyltransferase I
MRTMSDGPTIRLRRLRTPELTETELTELRRLVDAAFADPRAVSFNDDDWAHALGGVHFVLDVDGTIASHAAVVERELHVDGRPLRTGYVEAVATLPERQGQGLGSRVMRDVNEYLATTFELGALATSVQGFYERLGWQVWQGPTYVRTPNGDERTADEDGGILILLTPSSPAGLDLTAPISCEWRPGDVW